MVNLNNLAKEITLLEGKKRSVSVCQVKEILRITLELLAVEDEWEIRKLLRRYR